ncbi:MAG: SRPBCC family protein [Acidobacteriota bacterium]
MTPTTTPEFGPAPTGPLTTDYLRARAPLRQLVQEAVVAAPLSEVFTFFADARNLGAITPPWLGFRIQTPLPIEMREGALIDYRIRLGPVPLSWRTRIDSWEPPHRFVDSQLRGPYRCWWHEHTFEACGDTTRMTDRVLFAPVLGRLGQACAGLVVEHQLRRIFEYRAATIDRLFAPTGRDAS